MSDLPPDIVGNSGQFEAGAKDILRRAEAALQASVQTLGKVQRLTEQIGKAGAASAGETKAAEAINHKADAAERATRALQAQNAELRIAGQLTSAQTQQAAAAERTAEAAERTTAAARAAASIPAPPGQSSLFAAENAGRSQLELFPAPAGAAASAAGGAYRPAGRDVVARRPEPTHVDISRSESAATIQRAAAATDALAGAHERQAVTARQAALAERSATAAMLAESGAAGTLGERIGGIARTHAEFVLATGALFAGADIYKGVRDGAQEAQQGVQALLRVMEHPFNRDNAIQGFVDTSREMRVTIADAAEATQAFSRQFQNLPQAQAAARVALGFTKLDNISAADSARYLGATAQAFRLKGTDLEREVADPLEQVARRGGEQPAQLLRALQAAPTVANAGGDLQDYIGLAAAAIRGSGLTGNVVATAVQRSIQNFLPREQNQAELRRFNLDPDLATTNVTKLYQDAVERSKTLDAKGVRDLAIALFGPQYSKIGVALLQRPEQTEDRVKFAQSGRGAFEQELAAQFARVDEQFNALKLTLQQLGAELEAGGLLDGLSTLLRVFNVLGGRIVEVAHAIGIITRAVDSIGAKAGGIPNVGSLAVPALEAGGALALARRFGAGRVFRDRSLPFGGASLDPLANVLTGSGFESRRLNRTLNRQYRGELQDAYGQRQVAGREFNIAARSGDVEGQLAATQRLAALETRITALNGLLARETNATATAEAEVLAAKERQLATTTTEAAVTRTQAARSAVAGGYIPDRDRAVDRFGNRVPARIEQESLFDRSTLGQRAGEGQLFPHAVDSGRYTGSGAAIPEAAVASGRAARAGQGLARLGVTLGETARSLGPLALQTAAFTSALGGLDGFINTSGNALERVLGSVRGLTFGLLNSDNLPITRAENRAAGNKAAGTTIAGLDLAKVDRSDPRSYAPAQARLQQLTEDARQKAVALASQGDPTYRKAEAQAQAYYRALQALNGEVHRATLNTSAQRTSANASPRTRLQRYEQLTSKQLDPILENSLRPVTTVGDDSQLINARTVADAYAAIGHKKNRPDLLKKADDAAKQIVSAINSELTDDLALARSQSQRGAAYASALKAAELLQASPSADVARQGALLRRQVEQQQYQDAATAIQSTTGLAVSQQQTQGGKNAATVSGLRSALAKAKASPGADTNTVRDLQTQLNDAVNAQAQQQVADANATIDARYSYLSAGTTDPVKLARLAEQQAREKQSNLDPTDPNAGVNAAAEVRRTRLARIQTTQQASFDNIEFLAQLGKITKDQEEARLLALAERVKKTNKDLYRQALLRAHAIDQEGSTDLDIDLGGLRLGTPTQALSRIRGKSAGLTQNVSFAITVNGKEGADHVFRAIDRTIGTTTRSALRAGGHL